KSSGTAWIAASGLAVTLLGAGVYRWSASRVVVPVVPPQNVSASVPAVISAPPTNRERIELHGQAGRVDTLKFSPDGKRLFTIKGDEHVGEMWDLATNQNLKLSRCAGAKFSP